MRDGLGRTVNYLRLSITDRCNLRCCYCMPATGVPACGHGEILRYEELLRIARAAAALGIEKVRVTGGEPLVRKGVVEFLGELKKIPGLSEIALTTNGLLLADLAGRIRAAGVERLNVSLDSLNPQVFAEITRGGDLHKVLAGLAAAERAGLRLKLNMVVMRGINDHEVERFAALSLDKPWSVRFIEYMPTIKERAWRNRVIAGSEVLERLSRIFTLEPLTSGRLCGPARPYRIAGARGTIGIITPMTDHFCGACNRIRVTSTGLAKSCLLADDAVDLKPYLAAADTVSLQAALKRVVAGKGQRHHLGEDAVGPGPFIMAGIGG
jgi:cyclic pyranopterin phosphate synthase